MVDIVREKIGDDNDNFNNCGAELQLSVPQIHNSELPPSEGWSTHLISSGSAPSVAQKRFINVTSIIIMTEYWYYYDWSIDF